MAPVIQLAGRMPLIGAREKSAAVVTAGARGSRWNAFPVEAPTLGPRGAEPLKPEEVGWGGIRKCPDPEPSPWEA